MLPREGQGRAQLHLLNGGRRALAADQQSRDHVERFQHAVLVFAVFVDFQHIAVGGDRFFLPPLADLHAGDRLENLQLA